LNPIEDFEATSNDYQQTAYFGPGRRFRFFEILDIAYYACGFKKTQALPRTKIYHL
jgi:hypothetical protein